MAIDVSYTGASSSTDWIGFYAEGADLSDDTDWVYHHGTQDDSGDLVAEGTVQVTPPAAGNYYIAFLGNNGYEEIADRIAFTVGGGGGGGGNGACVDAQAISARRFRPPSLYPELSLLSLAAPQPPRSIHPLVCLFPPSLPPSPPLISQARLPKYHAAAFRLIYIVCCVCMCRWSVRLYRMCVC